ncbi:MAG: hypothetical protein MK076_04295 [Flavobacteriales bacterium]|nr:hypothetical protein [Flavobacteriales bacterium]
MDAKNVNRDFTISTEKMIENRIRPYNLNDNQKASVWKIVKERDQLLQQTKENQHQNFDKDFKKEYERLRGNQKPALEYSMNSRLDSNASLRLIADNNLRRNYSYQLDQIRKEAEKRIDAVLQQAQNKNQGAEHHLTNQFNRAHDHER